MITHTDMADAIKRLEDRWPKSYTRESVAEIHRVVNTIETEQLEKIVSHMIDFPPRQAPKSSDFLRAIREGVGDPKRANLVPQPQSDLSWFHLRDNIYYSKASISFQGEARFILRSSAHEVSMVELEVRRHEKRPDRNPVVPFTHYASLKTKKEGVA